MTHFSLYFQVGSREQSQLGSSTLARFWERGFPHRDAGCDNLGDAKLRSRAPGDVTFPTIVCRIGESVLGPVGGAALKSAVGDSVFAFGMWFLDGDTTATYVTLEKVVRRCPGSCLTP